MTGAVEDDVPVRAPARASASEDGGTNSTIYVGNLPPSTTDADLEGLFVKFGAVRALRNVTHPNGECRGFAFVDYTEPTAADAAIKAMNRTDFKGSQIVVEQPRRKWGDAPRRDRSPRPSQRSGDRDYRSDGYSDPRRYADDGYREQPRRGYGYADYDRRYADDRYYPRDRSPERDSRWRYESDRYY
jgi:RNA recognition motif-containing protein